MTEPLTLPTERSGVALRLLATEVDDVAYWEAYNASRSEIAEFDPDSNQKHQTLEDTRRARMEAGNKIRMGVWDNDIFVGSVNATPDEEGIEIGYWTDSRHTGNGYATLATRALSSYVALRNPNVWAQVESGNNASVRVLEKSGYRLVTEAAGKLIFELMPNFNPNIFSAEVARLYEAWQNTWPRFRHDPSRTPGPFRILEVARPHLSPAQIEAERPSEEAYAELVDFCAKGVATASTVGRRNEAIEVIQELVEKKMRGLPGTVPASDAPRFFAEVFTQTLNILEGPSED